jgi:outer membrane protein
MKKLVILLVLFSTVSFAQLNIGYVDSDTIMDEYPDAQDAQKKLDALIAEWKEELSKLEKRVQRCI